MSRLIQVGDVAIVHTGKTFQDYPIIGIVPQGILVRSSPGSDLPSLIIQVSPQYWQVYGLNFPHTIEFQEAHIGLSHLPEINTLILLELPYKDLTRVCQSNKEIYKICQDENFWRQKVLRDFPDSASYKPQQLSYHQEYLDLITVGSPKTAAKKGRLDILIKLEHEGLIPNTIGANLAAANGHLNVLEWLKQRKILPDEDGAEFAAGNGHLDVLKWLADNDFHFDTSVADEAAGGGHVEILEWLAEKKILPGGNGADWAAGHDHLNVLKWLAKRGIFPVYADGLNEAAAHGYMDVLEFLDNYGILPDEEGANRAAGNGQLNVLEWLEPRGILPNEEGVEMAARNGEVEALKWLNQHDIYPDGDLNYREWPST